MADNVFEQYSIQEDNTEIITQLDAVSKHAEDLQLKLEQSEAAFQEFKTNQSEKYQKLFKEHENLQRRLVQVDKELQEKFVTKSEVPQTNSTNRLEKMSLENLRLKADLDKVRTEQRAEAYKLKRQENAYNENISLKREIEKLKEESKRSKVELEKMVKEKRQFRVDTTKTTEQNIKLKGESLLLETLKKDKIKLEKSLETLKEERTKEKSCMDEMIKEIDRLKKALEADEEKQCDQQINEEKLENFQLEITKLRKGKKEMEEEIKNLQHKIFALNEKINFSKEDSRKLKTQLSTQKFEFRNVEKREKNNEQLMDEIEKLQGELTEKNIESRRKVDSLLKENAQLKKENEKLCDQVTIHKSDVSQSDKFKKDMEKMTKDSEGMIGQIKNLKSVIANLRQDSSWENESLQNSETVQEPTSPQPMKEFLREMSQE